MLERDVRDFFFKTKENYNLVAGQKELYIDGLRIDIFAIDKKGNPFIIEFKKDKNRHIVGQSAHYLALIPSKHQDIEKKLKFFNINWANLKVLCIAKSFNQRDFDALNFEPIKDRVFLYQYNIIKDYREKAIFGLDLVYTGESGTSPLYIPPKPTNALDFKEHFKNLLALEGKENKRQYYTTTILPLLDNVAKILNSKYNSTGLYAHISYFQSGPHALFRLGLDRKQSHRASVAVMIGENFIDSGFDLTHALQDAEAMQSVIKIKPDEIASSLLKLTDYSIYVPNTGIDEFIAIPNLNLKGMKLLLMHYQPNLMRECYFKVGHTHSSLTMTESDLVSLLEEELRTFSFLLDEIKTAGNGGFTSKGSQ